MLLAGGSHLREPAAHAEREVLASALPWHDVADDALGEHAPRPVVEVGELVRDLRVEGHQLRLARLDLRAQRGGLRLGERFLRYRELGLELA